ncbi:MAG: DNA replication protein DnaC [Ruminococcaceae bacterium]|nr:DNA replication protein DnaC [Oscillospiraceae bacterium]
MAYEQEIYKKIQEEYESLRLTQLAEQKERLFEVYEKCSKVKEIDEEITRVGSSAALEILKNPQNAEQISCDLKENMNMLSELRARELANAGFDKDYTDVRYRCNICKDTGYTDGKMCECFSTRLKREEYKKSNLFRLFETQSFDKFDINLFDDEIDKKAGISQKEAMNEALSICKSFADNFASSRDSLFFYGGVGLGKTFLSTCIAKQLIDDGYSVIYHSSAKLFSYYSDYMFGRSTPEEGRRELDKMRECDLLIIDDLGSEATNAQSVSFLFELVNDRLLLGKKMVISTNYSISEIAKVYSERLHSRILEHFIPVRFFGSDVRLKKMFK